MNDGAQIHEGTTVIIFPDPVVRASVVSTVARDFPALTEEVIERLHDHFIDMTGHVPSAMELRDYVAVAAEALDDNRLRFLLDLPRTVEAGPRPLAPVVPIGRPRADARRGPGRPGWTRDEFWARWRDACTRCTPPYTPRAIAKQFDTLDGNRGTGPDYVRKLVRRYGLPED